MAGEPTRSGLLPSAELLDLTRREKDFRMLSDDRGDISRGIGTAIDQVQGMGYGAAAAVADTLGADDLSGRLIEGYERNALEAGQSSEGAVRELEDIHGVGDAIDWAQFHLGSAIPTIGSVLASGGAAGAVGGIAAKQLGKRFVAREIAKRATALQASGVAKNVAARQAAQIVTNDMAKRVAKKAATAGVAGGSIGLSTGEIAGSIYEDGGEIEGPTSMAFGAVAGLLDSAPIFQVLGRVGRSTDEVKKTIATRLSRALKDASITAGTEGATEATQTLLEQIAVEVANDNVDDLSFTDLSEIVNAAAAGGLTGFVLGGGSSMGSQNVNGNADPAAQTEQTLSGLESQIKETSDPAERDSLVEQAEQVAKARATELREAQADAAKRGDMKATPEAIKQRAALEKRVKTLRAAAVAARQAAEQAEAADKAEPAGGAPADRSGDSDNKLVGDINQSSPEQQSVPAEPVPDGEPFVDPTPNKRVAIPQTAEREPEDSANQQAPNTPGTPMSPQRASSSQNPEQIRQSLHYLSKTAQTNGGYSSSMSDAKRRLERQLVDIERQDGDLLDPNDKPYKSEKAAYAQIQRRKLPADQYDVAPVGPGYVLRPRPVADSTDTSARADTATPVVQPRVDTEPTTTPSQKPELVSTQPQEQQEPDVQTYSPVKLNPPDMAEILFAARQIKDSGRRQQAAAAAPQGLLPASNQLQRDDLSAEDRYVANLVADNPRPVSEAASEAATSPSNDLPEPTLAQKEAGNYKLGHTRLHGLPLSIENPAGSVRRGKSGAGKSWETPMAHHYGYVKGTEAVDGDHVDVFVNADDAQAADPQRPVFVIDQVDPKSRVYDEPKVMIGFESKAAARKAYLANYAKGWKGLGAINQMSLDEFKEWVKSDRSQQPVSQRVATISKKAKAADASAAKNAPKPAAKKAARKKKTVPEAESYGQSNTFFTADAAEKARQVLREKLGQLSTGFDPEVAMAALQLGGFHVEAGARRYADFVKAMIADMGEGIRPFLPMSYKSVRDYPGFDSQGMDDDATITAESQKKSVEAEPSDSDTLNETQDSENQPDDNAQNPEQAGRADTTGRTGPAGPRGSRRGGRHTQAVTERDRGTDRGMGDERPGDGGQTAKSRDTGDDGRGGAVPAGNTGVSESAEGGRPELGSDADQSRVTQERTAASLPPEFVMDDPAAIIGGTPVKRFDKNVAALELLETLENEDRPASAEEQTVLAGYTGWGSFGQELFQGTWERPKPKDQWKKRDQWLRDRLGQAAWESAQRSIINAHYTDPHTVNAMWSMVERLGFDGGRVLEPAMGTGNFFSLMPKALREQSQLTGIELDETTGAIAKRLFPRSNVSIKGYQNSTTPDNFYDLVIGNWPFENTAMADRRHGKLKPNLHDFFFLKALDQVRPGGLVVGITSKGTMDKLDNQVRRALAVNADLVGAIRLPSGAFKEYAGTSVVTDIVILKKRRQPTTVPTGAWLSTEKVKTPSGEDVRMNSYFVQHPDHVLGTIDFGSGTTYGRAGMIVKPPTDMLKALDNAVELMPESVVEPRIADARTYLTNHTDARIGALTVQHGGLLISQGEQAEIANDVVPWHLKSQKGTDKRRAELESIVSIREKLGRLIEADIAGRDEANALRKDLRKAYQTHVVEHKAINEGFALKYLRRIRDPNVALLAALETQDNDGVWQPATFLNRSTVRKISQLEGPSVLQAYVLLRNQSVTPTLADVAKAANTTEDKALQELIKADAAYVTPTGMVEPSDVYLSGNVRVKLAEAQTMLEQGDQNMRRNIEALQEVIPKDIPYHEINVALGAPWLPISVFEDYVRHMLMLGPDETVTATVKAGNWSFELPSGINNRTAAITNYGTDKKKFTDLLRAAFANQTVEVRYKDPETGSMVLHEDDTKEANARIDKIHTDFKEWLWQDPTRATEMETLYNQNVNAYATPVYDGSFLELPGMALKIGTDEFSLRAHQKNAIWRGLVNRSGLYAHEVGTGKTFTMAGIAVESRRYGIANKPLIFAHNANSQAVAKEINMMYPGARVLYIKSMKADLVKETIARIQTEDWDAIVMPHSLIDRFMFKEETLMSMAQEDIDALESEFYQEMPEYTGETEIFNDEDEINKIRNHTAKALVKKRNKIIEDIKAKAIKSSRDDALLFEDTGIDMIIVDEVHMFKKGPIATRMSVKGLDTQTSQRGMALSFLTRYVQAQNGGLNVHTFTGTPITNTLGELFSQLKYVTPNILREQGIDNFNGFYSMFLGSATAPESNAAGEYEQVKRLSQLRNVSDLRSMISQYIDVVFGKDMPSMRPRKTTSGKTLDDSTLSQIERDELENGRTENATDRPYKKIINRVSDMSDQQKNAFKLFKKRYRQFRNLSGKEKRDAMLRGDPITPIRIENDSAKASFDMRLMDGERLYGQEGKTQDDPNSKAAQVVSEVKKIYDSHKSANQVIFMGRGISTSAERSVIVGMDNEGKTIRSKEKYKTFSTMKDIIERLVQQGIPREEIAVITGSTTAERKTAIAAGMNDGSIRVTLGSIQAMGVGVNMQKNLRAMHHLDAPWMPGDLEQANGRGWRQGNQWNTVLEYRWLTDGLDGRRWQVLAIKAKFIEAFLKAQPGLRTIESDMLSEGGDSSYVDSFSQAAGDPRILLRVAMQDKVKQLQQAERLYKGSVAAAVREKKVQAKIVEQNTARLGPMRASMPIVQALFDVDTDTLTLGDQTITGATEINKALAEFASGISDMTKMHEVGTLNGAPLQFGRYKDLSPVGFELDVQGQKLNTEAKSQPLNGLKSAARNYAKAVEKVEAMVNRQQASIERLSSVAESQFKQAADLQRAEAQVDRLEQDMKDNPVPPPAWLREGAVVGSNVVYEGKTYEVTGHRYSPEGWFVVADDGTSITLMPYLEVRDEQGMQVYDTHEWVKPDIVVKPKSDEQETATEQSTSNSDDDLSAQFNDRLAARRAGGASTGLRRSVINAVISRLTRAMPGAPRIKVVRTQADLPSNLDQTIGQSRGGYSSADQTIYIVADAQRSVLDLEKSLMHELTHFGVDRLFGKNYDNAMAALDRKITASGGLKKVLEDLGISYDYALYEDLFRGEGESASKQKAAHVDEVIAHLAESRTAEPALKRLARNVLQVIRQGLRKLGFRLTSSLAADELLRTVRSAQRQLAGLPAEQRPSTRMGRAAYVRYAAARRDDDIPRNDDGTPQSLFTQNELNNKGGPREQQHWEQGEPVDRMDMIQEMLKASNEGSDLSAKDAWIEKARNIFDYAKRHWLAVLSRRQLVEIMDKYLPRAKVYLRLAEQFDADRRELHSLADSIAERWSNLDSKMRTKLAAAMHISTIAQVDPSREYVPIITEEEYKAAKAEMNREARAFREARTPEGTGPLNDRKAYLERVWAQEKNRQKARNAVQEAWSRLDDEAKSIYVEARDHLNMLHKETENGINDRIKSAKVSKRWKRDHLETIKKTFELQRVQAPYFPLSRFGKYWVAVGQGNERTVDTFSNESAWQAHINNLEQEGHKDIASGRSVESLFEIMSVPPEFMAAVHDLIDKGKPRERDEANYALRDQLQQLYLSTLPELSARHHFQHRRYVKGFSTDALQGFAHASFHHAQNISRLRHQHKMSDVIENLTKDVEGSHNIRKLQDRLEILKDVRDNYILKGLTDKDAMDELKYGSLDKQEKKRQEEVVRILEINVTLDDIAPEIESAELSLETAGILAGSPAKRAAASRYVSELSLSHADMMSPNVSSVASAINSVGFFMFMGLSPAAAAINVTQVPLMHYPFLAAKYGHSQARKAIADSYRQFFARGEDGKPAFTIAKSVTGDELNAFNELVRRGVIDVTQSHDLAGLAEEGVQLTGATRKVMKVASAAFHHAERLNREVSAMSTYRLARQDGMNHDAAIQAASDMTYKTQFDYGSTNRARLVRGNWARVITQFKQYSASVTYLYVDTFAKAFGKNATAEEKMQARDALKSLLALQFAAAGALGMPLARGTGMTLEALVRGFTDEDEWDYEAALRQFTVDALETVLPDQLALQTATALNKGVVDGFTPIGLHGRLSLSELWVRQPFKELEGRDAYSHWLRQIAGPASSILESTFFIAPELALEGKPYRALEYLMPKAVRDVLKAARYEAEGVTTLSGNLIRETRPDEALVQLLGFTPSRVSNLYDLNSAQRKLQDRIQDRRSNVLSEVVDARLERDRGSSRKAQGLLRDFNARFPDYKITDRSIKQSMSSRERASGRVTHGVYTNPKLKGVLSQYDFAN